MEIKKKNLLAPDNFPVPDILQPYQTGTSRTSKELRKLAMRSESDVAEILRRAAQDHDDVLDSEQLWLNDLRKSRIEFQKLYRWAFALGGLTAFGEMLILIISNEPLQHAFLFCLVILIGCISGLVGQKK